MSLLISTFTFTNPKPVVYLAARITQALAPQRFEIIRDRIALILLKEIESQKGLQTNPEIIELLNNTKVFSERFSPLNASELLAVEIFMFEGDYNNKHPQSADGKYIFFMDLFGSAKESSTESGERQSAINLQKMAGMIRNIFEHPHWIRLGFDPSLGETFIKSHAIKSVKRLEEENNRDTRNTMMYRIVFEVQAHEKTDGITPLALNLFTTEVKISETELGYQYILDPNA